MIKCESSVKQTLKGFPCLLIAGFGRFLKCMKVLFIVCPDLPKHFLFLFFHTVSYTCGASHLKCKIE